jgi:hypothetical protein
MKKLTIIFSAIIIATAVFAQQAPEQKPDKAMKQTPMEDGVMNKDGKTWYIKSLTEAMSLDNGVVAMTDGTVKVNGKAITLHEGDCVNFQGEMIGLNQKITTVDGLVMRKNGTMWVWSILNRPIKFKNGTYALPDGTIKMTNGKYVDIKDKQFIDMDGNTSFKKW